MHRKPRRQEFFQEHKRVFTVIGAFILFCTFIAKEALREQVKDLVDSLRWAETTSSLETALQGNLILSVEIKKSVDSIGTGSAEQDPLDRPAKAVVRNQLDEFDLYLAEDWSAYHCVKELIDSLPDSEIELKKALKEFHTKRDSLEKRDDELTKINDKMDSSLKFRDTDESVVDELSGLGSDSEQFLPDIAQLNGKAIDRLTELKAVAEKRYERYTWLSYCLYALGWSLTLFGRLHGLESIAED